MDFTWIFDLFIYLQSIFQKKTNKKTGNNIEIKNSTIIVVGDIKKLTK